MPPSDSIPSSNRRLDSWKEIGAFFDRDERTVKRWEITRGLPVHRVPGGGRASVYANTDELNEWLKGKNVTVESNQNPAESPEISTSSEVQTDDRVSSDANQFDRRVVQRRREEPNGSSRPMWRNLRYAAIAMAILATLATVAALHRNSSRAERSKAAALHKQTVDPETEQLYLKGVFYFDKRTPETLHQAVDYFTQAVVRDPQYAEAYVGLANCYNLLREYSLMPPGEAYPQAMAAAKRAIALDDSLSGAHSSLAFVDFYWSWDAAAAQHEFERALALDPNSVVAHHWYATFLLHLARFPQSLEEIEKAQHLDPMSTSILADKGLILFYGGQTEQAVSLLKQLEGTDPAFLSPHTYLASIHLAQGDYAQYLAELRKSATLLQDQQKLDIAVSGEKGLASAGSHGMLMAMLKEQQTLQASGQESAYDLARTYALLGKKQEAVENLQSSYTKREPQLLALRIDPALSTLHSELRYQEILAKIGLPGVQ